MLETVLSLFFYLLFISIIFAFFKYIAKTPSLLALPLAFIYITFSLYLATLLFNSPIIELCLSLFLCLILSFILRNSFSTLQKEKISYLLIAIAFLVSSLVLITRSSIIISALNPENIYFPVLTDETKHVAVLTSIIANKDSVPFSYNPMHPFPYYYLYYLLPALPLKIFTHAHFGLVWVTHIFLTQFAFYLTAIFVFSKITKKYSLQIIGLLLIMFGTSFKFIPKIFQWYKNTETHIEHWYMIPLEKIYSQQFMTGWQISHPITVAIWIPQHQFAAMGLLLLYIFLFHLHMKPISIIIIATLLATIFGSSAFLGLGALSLFFLYIALYIKNKKHLLYSFITVSIFSLLIIPIYLLIKNNQANIIFQPYLSPLPYIPTILGVPAFYLMETGAIIPVVVFLCYLLLKQKVKQAYMQFALLSIITFVPLIVSRLVKSDFNNDFGLRLPMLFILFSPILIIFLLDKVKLEKKIYKTLIMLLLFSLGLGIGGGFLEIYYRTTNIENYHPLFSRAYRLVNKHTAPSDIIITNDSYFSDRVPVFSSRLALQPKIPFSMDVYVKQKEFPENKKYYYDLETCDLYKHVKQANLHYAFIYIEFRDHLEFHCPEINNQIKNATPILSSGTFNIYKIK